MGAAPRHVRYPPPPSHSQGDREVAGVYFDDAVRCRTAKINNFFLKYLTRASWVAGGGGGGDGGGTVVWCAAVC